jgi:glycosyltransferase involved in cell wall biosynthesis
MKYISVVVCTYNRCESLKQTIKSLAEQSFPKDRYEIVVIDNNSTDNTKASVEDLMAGIPNLRYAHEQEQGHNPSRNRGIKEASGEIVAFTDDDVEAEHNWVRELVRAFERFPDVVAVGGRTIPVFLRGRPNWLSDNLLYHHGDTQFGSETRSLTFPEHPFGLNMAFKKTCFYEVGFFTPKLGRKKTENLLSDDEKELFYRISKADLKTAYTPHAVIKHMIPSERTMRKWLISRSYWQGVSQVVFEQIHNPEAKLSLLKKVCRRLGSLMKTVCTGIVAPRSLDFVWLAGLFYQYGQASQYFRMAMTHHDFSQLDW